MKSKLVAPKKWIVLCFLSFILSIGMNAQNRLYNPSIGRAIGADQIITSFSAKTTGTATCPSSPVAISAQDSTNYVNGTSTTIANGATIPCGNQSIILYASGGSTSNENTPCIATEFSPYYSNIRTNVTETFYEGGQNMGCIGPSACYFPIGGSSPFGLISGASVWSLYFGYLDQSKSHDFQFCRTGSGSISTATVTLKDCWTGAVLSGPNVLSNATAGANSTSCFTMTVPAGTDIGTPNWSILPASASFALIDFHDGEVKVSPNLLPAGTYTVMYSFSPPASSGCAAITGNFKFTIGPGPTVSVNSPTVCTGNTATLTAGGTASSYSWTPSASLSASTGSVVTCNANATTAYTVTGSKGACKTTATTTVTINPTTTLTVNSATICAGETATLTASGAGTYTWSPSVGLNTIYGSTVLATPSLTTTYSVQASSASACMAFDTARVFVKPLPQLSTTSATVCAGDSALLTVSGASTYSWSPNTSLHLNAAGDSAKSGSNVSATYTVTGMIASCASSETVSVTIGIPSSIQLTASANPVCFGHSDTLKASGGNSYTWTPGAGISSSSGSTALTNTLSTTVSYTVHGSLGTCSLNPAVITITVTPIPQLHLSHDTGICFGTSASLNVQGASSYSWTPSAGLSSTTSGTLTASPAASQTYVVTGTTGNCSASDTVKLTIMPLPSFTLNGSANICAAQQTATLTASNGGLGALNYTWTPSSAITGSNTGYTVSATPLSNTQYTVYVSDSNGCWQTDTISVGVYPVPQVQSSDTLTCVGNSVILQASGASTYSWVPAVNLNASSGSSLIFTSMSSAIFTYTIQGEDMHGCRGETQMSVTVNDLPVISANSATICLGQTANLQASGAGSYSWTPSTYLNTGNGAGVLSNPLLAGIIDYTVTGIDSNHCSNKTDVHVTTFALPQINAGSDQIICRGDSIGLQVSGADSYVWNPATSLDNSNTDHVLAFPSATTNYTVSGLNAITGCVNQDFVTVFTNTVHASFSADPESGEAPLQVSFTNQSMGANAYTWIFGNGNTVVNTSTISVQTIYQNQGTYSACLIATSSIGCRDSACAIMLVSEGFAISIPTIFTPNGDGINDLFFIKSSGLSSLQVLIYDRWGLKIWESNAISGYWDGNHGSREVTDGTYFYIVKTTDHSGKKKSYTGNLTVLR